MALGTFPDLKAAIADQLARTDLSDNIDDFIRLFEAKANKILRVRQMETIATLTPDGNGICTLPADYQAWRRVTVLGSPRSVLEWLGPDYADYAYPHGNGGSPVGFVIIGSTLKPLPVTASNVELVYYQTIPALSLANPTNWLLTSSPDLYYYGAMVEACHFLQDDGRLVVFGELYRNALETLRDADRGARWGRAGARLMQATP
jgi:hypothetical protein